MEMMNPTIPTMSGHLGGVSGVRSCPAVRPAHVACQNFSLVRSEWVELRSATMQAN
jgi:hypothetical protein